MCPKRSDEPVDPLLGDVEGQTEFLLGNEAIVRGALETGVRFRAWERWVVWSSSSATDPSCRTSPNEQDQRNLAEMLHIPVPDPSTPQVVLGFEPVPRREINCSAFRLGAALVQVNPLPVSQRS